MSGGERGTRSAEPDDLAELPADDAERLEAAWLVARDNDATAPPPSREIANDYAQLEELLAAEPSGYADERWHDEVLRASSRRRSRVRSAAIAGSVAVAGAVALTLWLRSPGQEQELEVVISRMATSRSDASEVVVGDHLLVTARPRGSADLRVYRADGLLVGRCPDGPGCVSRANGKHVLDVVLDTPAQYQVILVVGATAVPPGASLREYIDAAHVANARVVPYPPIDVR